MNNDLILKILNYLEENLYAKITMEELSRAFYFNKDYIMRTFKKEVGMTIVDYLNKKKIYNSLKALKETDDFIIKVALFHGFTSQEYYTEIFTKIMGVTPNTYRKFTKNNPTLTYEEIETIRKNLTNLKYQLEEIQKRKQPTKRPTIRKLSRY